MVARTGAPSSFVVLSLRLAPLIMTNRYPKYNLTRIHHNGEVPETQSPMAVQTWSPGRKARGSGSLRRI
jgi:hypothetical protein